MLESIYDQTYSNYEVIITYDIKSTDNTLEIIHKYAKKIILKIDKADDLSIGCARNRGLKHANGDYIIFLDADDIITETYIYDLVQMFHDNPELNIVCGNRILASEKNVKYKYTQAINSTKNYKVYSQKNAIENLLTHNTIPREPWIWLVRRSFLTTNNINFQNISYGEDTIWALELILNSNQIGHCTKIGHIYIYIQHP